MRAEPEAPYQEKPTSGLLLPTISSLLDIVVDSDDKQGLHTPMVRLVSPGYHHYVFDQNKTTTESVL